jgi:hypothetical protein
MEDKALWFGSEFTSDDPRTQTEDLGDNAMLAGTYGIKNLRRVMSNLLKWTYVPHEGYSNLTQIYNGVTNQFEYYIGHVLNNIGGIYETPKTADQEGAVFEMVPVVKQKEAMEFLNQNVFKTPTWLIDTAVLARIGESPTQTIGGLHAQALNHLLNPQTLTRIAVNEAMYPDKAYRLHEYFADLDRMMWGELKANAPIDIYRRNLQRSYVDKLVELAGKPGRDYRDVGPILKARMSDIHSAISKSLPKMKDSMSAYHLKYIQDKLAAAIVK